METLILRLYQDVLQSEALSSLQVSAFTLSMEIESVQDLTREGYPAFAGVITNQHSKA